MSYQETELVPCMTCNNMGWVRENCWNCGGTGKINDDDCNECHGKGWVQVDCPDRDNGCDGGWKKRILPFRR